MRDDSRSGRSVRVLHVDDEPDFAGTSAAFVEREDERFDVETATSVRQGVEILAESRVDCVVSDFDMPGEDGLDFLRAVRETHPDLPFILFTGKGSEEIASEAISAGVTDYLQKGSGTDQYALLANRVRNVVDKWRARREADRTRSRLEAITGNSADAILTIDTAGTIRFANAAVAELFGYDPDALVGEPLVELMPPRYRETHLAAVERYLETGEKTVDWHDVEFPLQHRDGHEMPVSISFGEFEEDGQQRFVGIIRDISERMQMEEELRERERRFRQMAENIQEVFWMSDPDKEEMFYVNPAYEAVWGRSTEELKDEPASFLDAVHPEDRDRVEQATATQAAGGYDEEYRIVRPDGEVRWVRDRAVPVEDDAGEVRRIIGIASDITGRKEREREFERLRDMFDATERIADVGGWEVDPDTDEVFWSNHLSEMLGRDDDEPPTLDEALGVYLEADRPAVENALEEAMATGESVDVEARFERPEGEVRWLRILCEPTTEDGTVVKLRGAVQDITDHKEHERALKQARTEYEELFDGMNDTAWVTDPDGTFLAVNDAAVERTGYSRAELLSMRPGDLDAELADEGVPSLADELSDDEIRIFETVHGTKAGERVPVEICSTPITYRGEPAILSIGRDISDRKRREEQLEQFASVVSHDLRSPLRVAKGHLELAQESADSDRLEKVEDAHTRMKGLIDDLLALAREGDGIGEVEAVDLEALTAACWENVATGGATLATHTSGRVEADRTRLQQLLENLVRNAVEHGGPEVTVTVGELDDGFYVEDDGPGIPPDRRDEVFEAGSSTRDDGNGFGLSIVEQVAAAHGWEVAVLEGSDGGARFEVTGVESVGT